MRQFLLAGSGAYPEALPLTAGQFAITTLIDGKETISADGTDIEKKFYFNLKKAEGDTVIIAGYTRHFSFEKSVYAAGGAYTANVTITAPQADGHYTLILVKKGLKFNERNRWTATVPVKIGDSADAVAAKLGKFFEANATNLNVTVQVAAAKITITSPSKEIPIKLVPVNNLAFGKSIKSMTSSVTKVTVYGEQEVINEIEQLEVEIDVKGLEKDKDYTVTLKKPNGITDISTKTLTIKVSLSNSVEFSVDISWL